MVMTKQMVKFQILYKIFFSSDDEKKPGVITVFHKGIRESGLLRNNLRIFWRLGTAMNKNPVPLFKEEYPNNICNFQLIIEMPGDNFETIGLNFIQNNLSKLMENESLADIQFVFKDEQVPAHSAIVAASSPVFAAMFEAGRFKEGQTRTVNIEDIDSRVFRKLLQFLYTGSSGSSRNDSSDMLQALFLAADKYQVDLLTEICEEFLICQFEIENVLCHLEWAHKYGAEKLKETAVTYIVKRRKEVWKLKEWEDLSKSYPDVLFLVCKRMVN
jgi:BTB/POZ domain